MIHSILCQCRHRASGVDWDLNSLKDIDSTVHQDLVQSPLILLNSWNSSETQRNFYFINNKYSNRQSAQPYSVSHALLSSFVLFFEQFAPICLLSTVFGSIWFLDEWTGGHRVWHKCRRVQWPFIDFHFRSTPYIQESWRGERGACPGMGTETGRIHLIPAIIADLKWPLVPCKSYFFRRMSGPML